MKKIILIFFAILISAQCVQSQIVTRKIDKYLKYQAGWAILNGSLNITGSYFINGSPVATLSDTIGIWTRAALDTSLFAMKLNTPGLGLNNIFTGSNTFLGAFSASLNASQLTSGTIPDGRLPGNIIKTTDSTTKYATPSQLGAVTTAQSGLIPKSDTVKFINVKDSTDKYVTHHQLNQVEGADISGLIPQSDTVKFINVKDSTDKYVTQHQLGLVEEDVSHLMPYADSTRFINVKDSTDSYVTQYQLSQATGADLSALMPKSDSVKFINVKDSVDNYVTQYQLSQIEGGDISHLMPYSDSTRFWKKNDTTSILASKSFATATYAPKTTTVNGQPLSGNVTITNSTLGAMPVTDSTRFLKTYDSTKYVHWSDTATTIASKPFSTATYVPKTTTINGQPLSSNVVLDGADIGNFDDNFIDANDFDKNDIILVDSNSTGKFFTSYPLDSIITNPFDIGYTEFCARITQTGTSAPTVTVLKNTTGATVAEAIRNGVGAYEIAMSGNVFSLTKSRKKIEILGSSDEADVTITGYAAISQAIGNIYIITTLPNLTPTDGLLTSTVNFILEIRTYP